jgi:hypothetical protein
MSAKIPFDLTESKDTGFYVSGTTQSGKTTLAKHLVKQLTDNGINCYVLDISKAWPGLCSIDNVVEVKSTDTEINVPANQSSIIDLSELGYTPRIKYVTAFCKAIYNYHKDKGFKKAPFEFVIFEEAHTYFPNGCFRSPKQFSSCIDLATVGANFNLRFGAITQFPASLDKALVKVCQQRYFGWSTEMNDLNYIKSFVGKEYTSPNVKGKTNADSVFNLQKGQFLYQLRNKIEKIQSTPFNPQRQNTYTVNNQSVQMAYFL